MPGLSLLALARREVPLPRGGRMEMMLAPVEDWPQAIATIAPDAVICTLGTTQAKAGREGLREVDCTLVLRVAETAQQAGARQFVHLSSVGADRHAKAHYLSVKGEAEEGLRKLGFARLDILRPGLLRGQREGERRVLEGIGQVMAPVADLFLHGSKRRYRSVRAQDAAAALLQAVRTPARGTFVHDYDAIQRLARGFAQARSA
ncbi:NAD(P)H-binding protein [Aurantiacibacter xanthus]|uniref:NAD(P)H-binding protein n=1 Tax=Aurantiacibacter xanthus TaxID=1784712 RepID=UPI001FEC4A12|nr:NAD(P)H-binding protein [Aurantiacibacter xanthus]